MDDSTTVEDSAAKDSATPETPVELELDIESLSFGRAAIARHEGRVVFVEGAAPGDRVRATVTATHSGYDEAVVAEVLTAGEARVEPPCPLVKECGGCPWQHVDYQAQLEAKRDALVDCITRIGRIDNPPVAAPDPSPLNLGYRNRLKLRFAGHRMGFYRASTHRLVPVDDCMLAEPYIRNAMPLVEELVAGMSTQATRVEIVSRGRMAGLVVAINSRGRLRRSDTARVREFLDQPGCPVKGVVAWGKGWKREWGDTRRRWRPVPDGPTIEAPGTAFGQVNTLANELLVQRVLEAAGSERKRFVLELYAGAGNLTLPLAPLADQLVAVESDAAAAHALERSAHRASFRHVSAVAARAEEYLAAGVRQRPDLVVVDPTRSGLGSAAHDIARLEAEKIVYVSCNPSTLASDLRVLVDQGYSLDKVQPVDLFPHTFHVESVCTLRLT